MEGRAYDSPTVTIELHVATVSVLLDMMLAEERADPSQPRVFTRAWHRASIIDNCKDALLHWPPGSTASPRGAERSGEEGGMGGAGGDG